MLFVELEACLDEPDGVGGGACDDAGDGGSAEVYPGGLNAVVEGVGYYAFPVAVGGEVYRSGRTNCQLFFAFVGMIGIPCRDNPTEIRTKALEKSLPAFNLVYVSAARFSDQSQFSIIGQTVGLTLIFGMSLGSV